MLIPDLSLLPSLFVLTVDFFFKFFIGVYLLYTVVLMSAVQ